MKFFTLLAVFFSLTFNSLEASSDLAGPLSQQELSIKDQGIKILDQKSTLIQKERKKLEGVKATSKGDQNKDLALMAINKGIEAYKTKLQAVSTKQQMADYLYELKLALRMMKRTKDLDQNLEQIQKEYLAFISTKQEEKEERAREIKRYEEFMKLHKESLKNISERSQEAPYEPEKLKELLTQMVSFYD